MAECTADTYIFAEFDTVTVTNKKSIGFVAKDSKTNYAFFQTISKFPAGGTTIYYQTLIVKINYDPDLGNCATKAMNTPLSAKAYWPTDFCNGRFASCKVYEAFWHAPLNAVIYHGAIKNFKGQKKSTRYTGFVHAISLSTIDAGAT